VLKRVPVWVKIAKMYMRGFKAVSQVAPRGGDSFLKWYFGRDFGVVRGVYDTDGVCGAKRVGLSMLRRHFWR